MNPMMVLFMAGALNKDREKANKTIQIALPALIPMPPINRAVFATIIARQEAKREAVREKNAVESIVSVIGQNSDGFTKEQIKAMDASPEFNQYPGLSKLLPQAAKAR